MSSSTETLSEHELIAEVEELLKDQQTIEAFDLNNNMLRELIKVKIGGTGFSLSPNFKSIGWGENDTEALMIEMSSIANDKPVLRHELRHALHCLVCTSLFNKNHGLNALTIRRFINDVLRDPGFYEWRKKLNDEAAEKQWQEVMDIAERGNLDEIDRNSLKFGSILYQHAYFLDPLMCEAAASTHDSGFAKLNGALNRFVARYFIPGEQVLEGYGWNDAQKAFADAKPENKAMFMNKIDYSREKCFGIK